MAQPGDPIILDLALWDRNPSLFVRATIKADGVPIALSPINVPHLSNGRYFYINKTALKFPEDIFEIGIDYEIYKDSGYTEVSEVHAPAKDHIRLDPTIASSPLPPDITEELNIIKQLILAQGLGSDLVATVQDDDLFAELIPDELEAMIVESIELEALVDENDLIASIYGDGEELIAILEDN